MIHNTIVLTVLSSRRTYRSLYTERRIGIARNDKIPKRTPHFASQKLWLRYLNFAVCHTVIRHFIITRRASWLYIIILFETYLGTSVYLTSNVHGNTNVSMYVFISYNNLKSISCSTYTPTSPHLRVNIIILFERYEIHVCLLYLHLRQTSLLL